MSRRVTLPALLILLPLIAFGQQEHEFMTWVRFYKVKPDAQREFVRFVNDVDGEMLDGLVREGKLLSWGIAVPFTYTGEEWTHAIWFSYPTWSQLDDVMAAFEQAGQQRGERKQADLERRFNGMLVDTQPVDAVSRTVATPEATMCTIPQYFHLAFYKIDMRYHDTLEQLFKRHALPVYQELMNDGVIGDAGLARREIGGAGDWTHMTWELLPNLAAIDKTRRAFHAAEKQRPKDEQKELMSAFAEGVDMDAYRSTILRVVHFGGLPDEVGKTMAASEKQAD